MEKELPVGWGIKKLKERVKYQKGKKPKILSDSYFENSVPYLDIHAFEKGIVRQYADIESSNLVDERSIGVVWDGARSGWVTKGQKGAIGSTIAKLSPIGINIDFLYHFLKSNYQFINTNARGVGIPHVDPVIFWGLDIPNPPLPEQERIVAKLDSVFAHLEIAKQGLEKIPVLLKEFRQAVLTQAVTGKLTEEWREGKELEEWEFVKLEEVANVVDPQPSHRTPPISDDSIPYVSIKDVDKEGNVDLRSARPVSFSVLKEHINRYDLVDGDFGFGKIGTLGKPFLLPIFEKRCYVLSANIILIQPRRKCLSKYIFYYLDSPIIERKLQDGANATSQAAFGIKKARELETPLPSIEEQTEIVRRVEALFSKADAIEAQYKKLKEQIDQLPQAVLAKAFRGEV